MSRSKRDILDTEKMLERLATLLAANYKGRMPDGASRRDAEALRRISMTLHNWHELECGDSNEDFSRAIVRGHKVPDMQGGKRFEYDENGAAYLECHDNKSAKPRVQYFRIQDREAGALKRLKAIMARYPALQAYVQGDPRGCALYILKPGDIPPIKPHWCAPGEFTIDGGPNLYASREAAVRAAIEAHYSRGLAVHR